MAKRVSIDEAAEFISCSKSFLYRLIKEQQIYADPTTKPMTLEERDVKEWLESRRLESKAQCTRYVADKYETKRMKKLTARLGVL